MLLALTGNVLKWIMVVIYYLILLKILKIDGGFELYDWVPSFLPILILAHDLKGKKAVNPTA